MTEAREAKARLRQRVLAAVAALADDERERASEAARRNLLGREAWARAESVLLFAPMPGELDVWPLAEAVLGSGRRLALPCFNRQSRCYEIRGVKNLQHEVAPGYYGIREPCGDCEVVHVNQLDLLVVPGVAFDWRGYRLGRGKGYYDRLLAGARGLKCGTGFDQQLVTEVPVTAHDIRLDCILTPTRWIEASGEPLE